MKLHIGGEEIKEVWKILNAQNKPGVDYIGDISDLSQFQDNSVTAVYASHVLEHVNQKNILSTLKGIYRILCPAGNFYISVPDMDILSHLFISPLASKEDKYLIMRMMFGGQTDQFDFHYFGWNQQFIYDFLKQCSFSDAKRVLSFDFFDDTSNMRLFGAPVSLNVIATK